MQRLTSAGYMTNWTARLFAQAMDREIAPHGLTSAYLPVVFALVEEGELTQSALAERAAIEQPTMAATLKRMERDGLIARRPDPKDRRKTLIALCPDARARVAVVAEAVETINGRAFAGIEADERELFLALLARIVGNLETHLAEKG